MPFTGDPSELPIPYGELNWNRYVDWLEERVGPTEARKLVRKQKLKAIERWKEARAAGDPLVKVVAKARMKSTASGYVVHESTIRGKSVSEIERALGLAPGYLGDEMVVQEFKRLPTPSEFEFRGNTALHPGTHPSYRTGTGVPQWELTNRVPVRTVTTVQRGDVFRPAPSLGGGSKKPYPVRGGTTLHPPPGARTARVLGLVKTAGLLLLEAAEVAVNVILMVLEHRLSEQESQNLRRLWKDRIGKRIEPRLQSRIAELAESRPAHPVRWLIVWRLVTREMSEEGLDAGAWFWRFLSFNPGFVELVEDIRFDIDRGLYEWTGRRPYKSGDKPRVLGEERADGGTLRIRGPMETQILISDPEVWELVDAIGTGHEEARLQARYWGLSGEQRGLLEMLSPAFVERARAEKHRAAALEKAKLEAEDRRRMAGSGAYETTSTGERKYY